MLLLILIAQIVIGAVVLVRIESDDDYSFKDAVRNETENLFKNYTVGGENNAIHVIQYTVSGDTNF